MADKYNYKSEEEFKKVLDSFKDDEKALKEFLESYTKEILKKETEKDPEERTTEVTAAIISTSASAALVSTVSSQLEEIESGKDKTDTSEISSSEILSKALNKTIRGSASTMPRFHNMKLSSAAPQRDLSPNLFGLQANFIFIINTVPAGSMASIADQVVSLEDVSVGAPFPNTSSQNSGTWQKLYFDFADYGTGSQIQKDIKVTWLSGYTKTFTLFYQHLSNAPYPLTSTNNAALGFNPHGCLSGQPASTQYISQSHKRAIIVGGSATKPILRLAIGEPLQNPGGNFEPFEIVSEWPAGHASTVFDIGGWGDGFIADSVSGQHQWFNPDADTNLEQQMRVIVRDTWQGLEPDSYFQGFYDIASLGTDATYGSNYTSTALGYGTNPGPTLISNTGNLFANASAFRSNQSGLSGLRAGQLQTHITYADNLSSCLIPPPTAYDVCLNPTAPDYYQTTCLDCNGAAIPANECNGSVAATFNDGQCCTDCSSFTTQVTGVGSTYGNQDGEIFWDASDPAGSLNMSGTPWTSGSGYTVTLTTSTGVVIANQPPAGGTTFNVNVTTVNGVQEVTIPSNAQVSAGMLVSGTGIPIASYVGAITAGAQNVNVTKFLLVDANGASVLATAGATVVGTFSVQVRSSFANLLPNTASGLGVGTYYTLCVTDEAGCVECSNITLGESAAPTGCTDLTAFNYDSTAVTDDGSCSFCDATSGAVVDPSGSMAGSLFPTGTAATVDATVNTSNVPQTDGSFSLTATMQNTAAALALQTDGTQSYTYTLIGLSIQGDITSSTGTVATQAGLAVTTYGNSPTHTFTGLDYGHYAIKVQLVDNDEASPLEPCFEYFYGTVLVPVCADLTASNTNSSNVPLEFQSVDNSLCTYPANCCVLTSITENTTTSPATACAPILEVDVSCDPDSVSTYGHWNLNGSQIAGSAFTLGSVSAPATISLTDSFGTSLYTSNGTYEIELTSTYSSGPDCTITQQGSFTLPICGCTDPTALNYDPTATIDDGSCIYPSWDCVLGNCIDPGTGTGQYNSGNGGLAQCQLVCIPITLGCTDPCANNYNSAATVDDGSCLYKACLDPTASNQYWSCDCNALKPSATVPDIACCTYPCAVGPTVSIWSQVDSTGTCTTPLADGDIRFQVTLNNAAVGFYFEIFDATGTTSICATSNFYNSPLVTPLITTLCGTGLVAGNYQYKIEDNLGCITTGIFTINTTSPSQGCTDPAADNYDPNAVCDDSTCVYCGCMDPLANNYNPNAVCDDGSCEYTIPDNPCVPPNIDRRILEIDVCLSEKGTTWLNKYKIGMADDCTIMNKWKLILIQYLLKQKGLTCLYNCADEDSPDASSVASCGALAATGGPNTGLNDVGFAGSTYSLSTGTTVTNPALYFVAGNTLQFGDVITMPSLNGNIAYQVVASGGCTSGCYDPQTSLGMISGHWIQCVPSNNITITNSINYLENFINFANKYCRDCKIEISSYKKNQDIGYNG